MRITSVRTRHTTLKIKLSLRLLAKSFKRRMYPAWLIDLIALVTRDRLTEEDEAKIRGIVELTVEKHGPNYGGREYVATERPDRVSSST